MFKPQLCFVSVFLPFPFLQSLDVNMVLTLTSQVLDDVPSICFCLPRRPGICEWGRIPGNLWHQTRPVWGVRVQCSEWCSCTRRAESENHRELWVSPSLGISWGKAGTGSRLLCSTTLWKTHYKQPPMAECFIGWPCPSMATFGISAWSLALTARAPCEWGELFVKNWFEDL